MKAGNTLSAGGSQICLSSADLAPALQVWAFIRVFATSICMDQRPTLKWLKGELGMYVPLILHRSPAAQAPPLTGTKLYSHP